MSKALETCDLECSFCQFAVLPLRENGKTSPRRGDTCRVCRVAYGGAYRIRSKRRSLRLSGFSARRRRTERRAHAPMEAKFRARNFGSERGTTYGHEGRAAATALDKNCSHDGKKIAVALSHVIQEAQTNRCALDPLASLDKARKTTRTGGDRTDTARKGGDRRCQVITNSRT